METPEQCVTSLKITTPEQRQWRQKCKKSPISDILFRGQYY